MTPAELGVGGAPAPVRHPIAWGTVSAAALVAVLVFGLVAAHMSIIDRAELPIVQWFSLHHFSVGTAIANGVVVVFEPLIGAVVIVVVGVLILAATRRMWPPALFLLLTFGTLAGAQVLKWLVQRDRPPLSALADPPAADPTYSFPSGHTTVATVLVVALLIVVPGGWKWLTGVVGGAVVVLVAVSRVYLGAHYPSDVIASILVGIAGVVLLRIVCCNLIVPLVRRLRSGRSVTERLADSEVT